MSISNHQGLSINLSRFDAWLKPVQRMLAQVPLAVWQKLVRFLLVFWLAYSLAQVFWILFPSPSIPTASLNPDSFAVVDKTSGAKASVDIARLKSLTPFGNPAAATPAPEIAVDTTQAADTQLNLILKGLFYSNDEKMARAVIAASDRQDVFSVGDSIPVGNNVTLAKILPDRVIISNNGKPETLWLFKDDPNAPRIAANYAAPQPMNRSIDEYNNQPPVYYQESEQPVASVPATPINSPEDQARISRMNTSLADVVSMSIHREGGQIVGYKIRPGRNAEMFSSLGLQTDDVVTAVNGMPLDNPGKIMEIYRNLGGATSANLEIMRNGSRINVDISLN